MEITKIEMDNILLELEKKRLNRELDKFKELRNQLIDLNLRSLMEYDREADIIGLAGAEELLELIKLNNKHILEMKEELNNISK